MRTKLIVGAALALAIAGCAGEKGEKGDPGATGANGAQGPQGPAGADGTNGTNGTNGATGATGATGPQGPQGETGATGPQGPQGPAGQDGQDGVNGTNGTNGVDGRNAYVVGGGLVLTLQSAAINGTTATVRFAITDASGRALDRDGRFTEGSVSASFILAWLGETSSGQAAQYTAYTTRTQTSPITGNSAVQAGTDSGGTFTLVDADHGVYDYTFRTAINVDPANVSKTHTVAAYATRTYKDVRYVSNAELNFRPDGQAVTVTREAFDDTACNACHNPLEAHGGARRDGQLCITCHTAQTTDPDTGNTVDMKVMIHKIHMGEELPSVLAGTPYQIIGFGQSVIDFSTVAFPGVIYRCDTCHSSAQLDYAATRPSRAACGSCHDRTSFVSPAPAGYTLHSAGAQADDANCTLCHTPTGGLAGIRDKHMYTFDDPATHVPVFTIRSVTNTAPGQFPVVTFNVQTNGTDRNILTSPLSTLRVTVYGPTTDVASYWQNTVQGTGATGTLVASGADFVYTMSTAMPADAHGSYNVSIEGYDTNAANVRVAGFNPIMTVAVTDATPVARREIVDHAKCNSCHNRFGGHGGQRINIQYCAACHNPNNDNDDRVSRLEGSVVVAHSVNFKDMIHRIHRGEEGANEYVLGGNPTPSTANPLGTPVNFGELRFPGDLRDCETCHKPNTYGLPLARGLLPSMSRELTCTEDPAADTNSYCNTRVTTQTWYVQPEAAACRGCHDDDATAAHTELQTTASGAESCSVCHGAGKDYDVLKVHAVQ